MVFTYMQELCFLKKYIPDFAVGINEKCGYILQKLIYSKFGKFQILWEVPLNKTYQYLVSL